MATEYQLLPDETPRTDRSTLEAVSSRSSPITPRSLQQEIQKYFEVGVKEMKACRPQVIIFNHCFFFLLSKKKGGNANISYKHIKKN